MDLTLVPFGYSVSQDQLVDVYQVDSGKRCGCECPSCHTPLIARKGNKKIWHFAHDSGSDTKNEIEKCRYSFYVSVRMMARQQIGNRLSIRLPRCEVTRSERVPLSTDYVHVSELVTESREVVLDDVSSDAYLGSSKVDLSGYLDGYCLAIVFTHPGRDDFSHLAHIKEKKTGLVAISLTGLNREFADSAQSKSSYKEILERYISHDLPSKKWIYHPRLFAAEQRANDRLANELSAATSRYQARSARIRTRVEFDESILDELKSRKKPIKKEKHFIFTCRLCNSTWPGIGETQASCSKCGSALLVSREEIPEDKI